MYGSTKNHLHFFESIFVDFFVPFGIEVGDIALPPCVICSSRVDLPISLPFLGSLYSTISVSFIKMEENQSDVFNNV